MPTLSDLSRLMSLQYVRGGSLRGIPHGTGASFEALATDGLVSIECVELIDGFPMDIHATIAERGIRVVEAGMNAMVKEVSIG